MPTDAHQPAECPGVEEVQGKPSQAEDAASDLSTEPGEDLDQSEEDGKRDAPIGFSVEETLIIFDWDDTLCPTTWIQEQGLLPDSHLSKEQTEQLGKLTQAAKSALLEAKRAGRVVIVTNAGQGWVQICCEAFMPALAPSLQDVEVISARSSYEWFSGCPTQWKRLAFTRAALSFFDGHQPEQRRNIISLGDAVHERIALVNVTEDLPNCRGKFVKFMERPPVEKLAESLELVTVSFGHVAAHDGDLDLHVSTSSSSLAGIWS